MPELLEVETYRELADRTVGRRIATVEAPDTWFLKGVTASQVVDAKSPRDRVVATSSVHIRHS